MASGGSNPKSSDRSKSCVVVDSVEGVGKGEEEGKDGERKSLLNGGMAGKRRKKSSRRRVQWNDRNGNKLVEVLEFQPSDPSDSEDEYMDSCICTIM